MSEEVQWEKIKQYLSDIKIELTKLEETNYGTGKSIFFDLKSKLTMAIRRIYPEYEKIEQKLIPQNTYYWNSGDTNPTNAQKWFLDDVTKMKQSVNTIIEELEFFGTNFEPLKQRTENEFKIGLKEGISFRKKISTT